MACLYEDLFHQVLYVLNAGDVRLRRIKLLFQVEGHHVGEVSCQCLVLTSHGLGGLEDGVGYLGLVKRH